MKQLEIPGAPAPDPRDADLVHGPLREVDWDAIQEGDGAYYIDETDEEVPVPLECGHVIELPAGTEQVEHEYRCNACLLIARALSGEVVL